MRKTLLTVVGLMVVLSMLLAPTQSNVKADTTINPQEGREYEELPQEVIDAFADGMTVDEFLAQNKGPIPMALWDFTDQKIAVVIEMEAPALLSKMLAEGDTPESAPAYAQKDYAASLLAAQAPLATQVAVVGGTVISHYTKAYNGVLALVPANQLNGLRDLPGVKAIHNAPEDEPTLSASVPLIGAVDVWEDGAGYTGEDVTIAVIDTGIDYTHAAFGGEGTAAAYAANDPDVVEEDSFPTLKVIGGYDLAGTAYDAGSDGDAAIPVPDDDPLDEGGHGTHVASTAAGIGVDGVFGPGVAPDASLYAFKVFGADGSTNLAMNAIEMAMDPNGDGDLSDRVDVINMSLGSIWGVADENDPEQAVIELISAMGTVVVVSAGNAGNSSYITGAPAVSDAAISVAASSTGYITLPTVKYGLTPDAVPYLPANSFNEAITAPLADVNVIDGDSFNGLLCATTDVPEGSLTGTIALIQRGTCSFEDKINNAAALGAVGAIIYNGASNPNEYISMAVGTATLPAGFTLNAYGVALKAAHGTAVTVGPDSDASTFAFGDADTVASFSSRGPRGYDSKLKPEITAPGLNIYAAAMGSGAGGVSMSGTSMAAPHVAGVAALMKEAHPDWSVEQIKAALMSTADDMNSADVNGYQVVPLTGAGRVNVYDAIYTPTIVTGDAKLVSLSWGVIEYGEQTDNYVVPESKMVRIQNLDTLDETYDVTVEFTDEMPDAGATLDVPSVVTISAESTGFLPVSLILHPDAMYFETLEEYYGFIVLTPRSGADAVRVPFYFVPRPYNTLTTLGGDDVVPADYETPAIEAFGVTGSTQSSLWGYTLVGTDANEFDVADRADLRAVGMDYGGSSPYGEILTVAFNNWGSVHTPQPYYSETDLYMDVDEDGVDDYVFFNFNYGWLSGGDEDNDWIVLQIDLASGILYLGSPWTYGDFNSGLMEWYLPDAYDGFNDDVSTLDFSVVSFDGVGGVDEGPAGTFDYLNPPYWFDFADDAPLGGSTTLMGIWLNDGGSYLTTQPLGALLVDYNGKPGYGQAYPIYLTVTDLPKLYIPFINK